MYGGPLPLPYLVERGEVRALVDEAPLVQRLQEGGLELLRHACRVCER